MSDFRNDCKQQLLAAAGELFEVPVPRARRLQQARRVRRGPLLVAIALVTLVLAAAALAATGVIGFGAPVRAAHPPGRERPTKTTGIGIPVAPADGLPILAQPLAISVRDPASGLPWGMRIVRTTRGLLCLQIGRLLDGRLGVLGQDDEFGDDGLFHELPATVLDPGTCIAPSVWTILSDDGLPAAGALQSPSSCVAPWLSAARSGAKPCPADDEREIGFGVLGPHAVSVSYMVDDKLHTIPTVGRLGAYLIVLRVPPKLQHNAPVLGGKGGLLGGFPIGAGRGEVVSRLLFRYGGHLCQTGFDRQPEGPPQCTSHISHTRALLPPRLPRGLRTSVALEVHRVRGGYELRVTFTAPVAVTNASTAYGIQVTRPSSLACGRGGIWGQSIERDVPRGQALHFSEFIPQPSGCRGVVRGEVLYGGQPLGDFLGSRDLETIGRFSFDLP